VTSLVDFSFVRSIVTHKYCLTGFAYDPVSLFLLELFRYLEKYPSMKDFVEVVRDRDKGRHYRLYASIQYPHLPCEATFTLRGVGSTSQRPDDIQRPKVEVLTLSLDEADPEKPSVFNQIFGLENELHHAGLDLNVKRGVIAKISMGESSSSDSFFFKCPKLPSDREARIGVRRDPQNPNRKQKIFGFNAVIDTSIEMEFGLELPVACSTLAGNAQEGKHYILNREQVLHYHGKTSRIDLADAKYDEHDNYAFSRSHGAILSEA